MFNLIYQVAALLIFVLTVCVYTLGITQVPMTEIYILYALLHLVLSTTEDLYYQSKNIKEVN